MPTFIIGLILTVVLILVLRKLYKFLKKSSIDKKKDELSEVNLDEKLTSFDETIVDKKTSLKKRKEVLTKKEKKLL